MFDVARDDHSQAKVLDALIKLLDSEKTEIMSYEVAVELVDTEPIDNFKTFAPTGYKTLTIKIANRDRPQFRKIKPERERPACQDVDDAAGRAAANGGCDEYPWMADHAD